MDQYAVFGNPVGHSKSPLIHSTFAKQTGESLAYQAVAVEPEQFSDRVEHFFQQGKGLNITVPFKQNAWQLAKFLTPRAKVAGAVNTLYLDAQGQLCGDNTDGIGMVSDLINNHQICLKDSRILILGAGGAVRGVLLPVLEQQPAVLTIVNRTAAKAVELAVLAEPYAADTRVKGGSYDELQGETFDLIINGTSASLQGELPPLPDQLLASGGCCYDMMYGPSETPFLLWGRSQGATHLIDGLGMLVEQAAESFSIWRGVKPNTQEVIEQVRAAL